MKNLKISMKLIICFSIVAVLAGIVGGIGIYGMVTLRNADSDMYTYNTKAIEYMGRIRANLQNQRVEMRNLVIHESGTKEFNDSNANLKDLEKTIASLFQDYETTILPEFEEDERDYYNGRDLYNGDFTSGKNELVARAGNDDVEGALEALNQTGDVASQIVSCFANSMDYNSQFAADVAASNVDLQFNLTLIQVGFLLVAIALAVILGLYNAAIISRPVKKMADAADLISVGNMNVDVEYDSQDEVGMLSKSFSRMISGINTQTDIVEKLAEGDLTMNVTPRSPQDNMGIALEKMLENMNSMFAEINNASGQVSSGAKQVADGAQILAQGSTEQASTIQELSASMSNISDQAVENSHLAQRTAELGDSIKENAEKGSTQMEQMVQAVGEINEASQSISKVIKVIDDIAFQTNILALNAAVEAARAGQHGKGFAVVAEEVRNLAAKSAEAAKETSGLIENSVSKAELGARIANETAASLSEIVKGINESSSFIGTIAESSGQQAGAVKDINVGIEQVATVVQSNSATAEQSAAAAEEMSSQSVMLTQLISRFKLKDSSRSVFGGSSKNKGFVLNSSNSEHKSSDSSKLYMGDSKY